MALVNAAADISPTSGLMISVIDSVRKPYNLDYAD